MPELHMPQPTNRTGVVNKVDPYPQILGGFADGQPRPSVSDGRLFRRCAHVSHIDKPRTIPRSALGCRNRVTSASNAWRPRARRAIECAVSEVFPTPRPRTRD